MKSVPCGYRGSLFQMETHLILFPWAWEAPRICLLLFNWNEILINTSASNQSPAKTATMDKNLVIFLCWLRELYTVVKENWDRPKKSRILKPPSIYSVTHRKLRQIVKQRRAKVGSSNLSNTHLDSNWIQLNNAQSQQKPANFQRTTYCRRRLSAMSYTPTHMLH